MRKKANKAMRLMAFLLALNVVGCLTPISNPADQTGGRLVVSGQVSNLSDRNIIQLGRTSANQRLPFPESGAFIQLIDETESGSYSFTEDFSKPGSYYLDGVSGVPGHTYHVQIILATGEEYASQSETIPAKVGKDSVYYTLGFEEFVDFEGAVQNQPFLKIYSTSTLAEREGIPYIKWNTEECYLLSPTDFPDPFGNIPPPCFITQNADPQRVVLLDGSVYTTDKINDQLICSRIIDRSFFERHYFTIYQSYITGEAHEYWRKVNIVANQTGSIFDTPPAEINGNIFNVNIADDKVYGYFQAVHQSYSRFFLLPSYLPFPIPYKDCVFRYERPYNDYSSECLDCLSVRNSSHTRPDWF